MSTPLISAPPDQNIITWGGNTPEWNRILRLGALRLGCSSAPDRCVEAAERQARAQGVDKVFLAVRLRGSSVSEAREYSQMSLRHPVIFEVGFDDFVGQASRQNVSPAVLSAILRDFARGLRSANPSLRLGLTIYEDELSHPRFPLATLDEEFRRSVNFVHLYPHYRREEQSFAASVRQAREIFPAAEIIAGIYAYDRRDYLPCSRNGSPCTNEEELRLFRQTFEERLAMLANDAVSWMEFYPGDFGMEEQWKGWQTPRSCRPDRRPECVANTRAMREVVRRALSR